MKIISEKLKISIKKQLWEWVHKGKLRLKTREINQQGISIIHSMMMIYLKMMIILTYEIYR